MGDNVEHRDGRQSGSSGSDSGAVDDPQTQIDPKALRSAFNGRTPE